MGLNDVWTMDLGMGDRGTVDTDTDTATGNESEGDDGVDEDRYEGESDKSRS